MYKVLKKPLKVSTPEGYKIFTGIQKYIKPTLIITTNKNEIEVAQKHRFVVNKKEIFAKDLKVNDILETKDGFTKVLDITIGSMKDVYDLTNVEGEVYYTNNILSHNTFLGSSNTLISGEALKSIEPLTDEDIIFNSLFQGLRIFEEPKENHHYIITVDPKIDGADKVGIQVIDVTSIPFIQVAAANLEESYLMIPSRVYALGEYYNRGMIVVENNIDMTIADALYYQYEYEGEVFKEKSSNGKSYKQKLGFRTTTKSKKITTSMLKKFIEEGLLIINDKKTLEELFNFLEKKNGTFSAEEGYHDDLVMALTLLFAPFINIKDWSNFKGFVDLMEVRTQEKEREEDDTMEFLDLGFSFESEEDKELPFSTDVWEDIPLY